MSVQFSARAMKFLRDLKKHNERDWFEANKPVYEAELKAPMLALAEEINAGLAKFAPVYVRPPQKAVMRIYRDIRFSANKLPYKTHLAAWWSRQGLEKTSGGGFYVEVGPERVMVAGGMYMPHKEQLAAVRHYLVEHHEEYRKLIANKKLLAAMELFDGQKMARGPKGFDPKGPAMDLILQQQWGVSAALPAAAATEPGLAKVLLERMKLALPVVEFLNAPLVGKPREPLF